jgi:hypothetical protein
MKHASENPGQPEQMSFFPEDEEFVKVMDEIRKEYYEKRRISFSENDEALKELARLRIAHRKSGKPSFKPYQYGDNYRD